jgi:hypothetical protein
MRIHRIASTLGVLTALLAAPVAASADPPAVGAPTIPPVFVGAPTNDNPNAGQFQVNFDSSGYRGIGIAPEPPLTRDLKPGTVRAYAQARPVATTTSGERSSVDSLFVGFRRELRTNASIETALRISAERGLGF